MLEIVVGWGLYYILGYARKKVGWRSFVCEQYRFPCKGTGDKWRMRAEDVRLRRGTVRPFQNGGIYTLVSR